MTQTADLFTGTRRLFWGYFFLLLDFNLNFNSDFTIPLLPNFVGWIFLWRGVDALSSARPSDRDKAISIDILPHFSRKSK